MLTRLRDLIVRLYEAWRLRAGVSLAVPGLVAASFVMLFALDPFGIEAASHARSEQATLRITAPWYEPSGQVTAVVIDDEYIRKRSAGWPLSYGDQSRLIRSILAAKPAVLVIDLVYPHRHTGAPPDPQAPPDPKRAEDSVTRLIDPIVAAAQTTPEGEAATTVVFTAMAREPGASDFKFCPGDAQTEHDLLDEGSIQGDLLERIRGSDVHPKRPYLRLAYVRWSGCGNRYPLLLGGSTSAATPAFEAFRAYCRTHPMGTCPKTSPAARPEDLAEPEDYRLPMIVRSGAFPPSTQGFAYDPQVCQKFAERRGKEKKDWVSPWRKLWVSFEQATLGLFADLRNDPRAKFSLPCPAVTVVPLSVLETASAEDLTELFTGKAVLIGANLSGIPDAVASQVHGQIPGVVWHAMALDNLIALGSGYLADRHEDLQRAAEVLLVLVFAYLFPFIMPWLELPGWKTTLAVVSLVAWGVLAGMQFYAEHPHIALLALLIGLFLDLSKPTVSAGYVTAVAIAALCSIGFLRRGLPPGNWFGLVIVVIGFVHTVKSYFRGAERKHFPHPASVLGPPLRAVCSLTRFPLKGDRK